jgi:serine/threonine-protein kinase
MTTIGQVLAGRYRLTRVLGAGGFGETYVAVDLHLPGEPACVVKQLKPASDKPEVLEIARRLFKKEGETLATLGSHDRIPRLLAFFEQDNEFYLSQELVVGHPFSDELVEGKPFSEVETVNLLTEVLEILDFIHRQGVIHRDLKPDNLIRRDRDGKLVLIDFGAIKQVRNQYATSTSQPTMTVAIGTPGYMPSEQAAGVPRPASDLYALGIIGIQSLSGISPHNIPSDDDTGELVWEDKVKAHPQLIAILQRLTRYHFKDRFSSAAEALQVIQAFRSGTLQDLSATSVQIPPNSLPAYGSTNPSFPIYTPPPNSTSSSPNLDPTLVVGKDPASSGGIYNPNNNPTSNPYNPPAYQQQSTVATPSKPKGGFWKLGLGLVCLSGLGGFAFSAFQSHQRSAALQNRYRSGLTNADCRVAAPTRERVTKVREKPEREERNNVFTSLNPGTKVVFLQREEGAFMKILLQSGREGWVFNNQIGSCKKAENPPTNSPTPAVSASPLPSSSSTATDDSGNTDENVTPAVRNTRRRNNSGDDSGNANNPRRRSNPTTGRSSSPSRSTNPDDGDGSTTTTPDRTLPGKGGNSEGSGSTPPTPAATPADPLPRIEETLPSPPPPSISVPPPRRSEPDSPPSTPPPPPPPRSSARNSPLSVPFDPDTVRTRPLRPNNSERNNTDKESNPSSSNNNLF